MTTSQKFATATETITAAMATRRDEILQEELDEAKKLTEEGHKNPELEAYMRSTFGLKDAAPSKTPRHNPNYPGPRPTV